MSSTCQISFFIGFFNFQDISCWELLSADFLGFLLFWQILVLYAFLKTGLSLSFRTAIFSGYLIRFFYDRGSQSFRQAYETDDLAGSFYDWVLQSFHRPFQTSNLIGFFTTGSLSRSSICFKLFLFLLLEIWISSNAPLNVFLICLFHVLEYNKYHLHWIFSLLLDFSFW